MKKLLLWLFLPAALSVPAAAAETSAVPNGLGLSYPTDAGDAATGIAPNELTSVGDRDRFVGTPWHKHVPAKIERIEK